MTWTTTTMKEGLEKLAFYKENRVTATTNDNSLVLTFEEFGELPVIMVVGEKQIMLEVALVERDVFKNPSEVDYKLLTTHKYLPLSTIGIESINGTDWYVLFGALSKHSTIELIAEELLMLVRNTFNVIDTLEPLYKFNN